MQKTPAKTSAKNQTDAVAMCSRASCLGLASRPAEPRPRWRVDCTCVLHVSSPLVRSGEVRADHKRNVAAVISVPLPSICSRHYRVSPREDRDGRNKRNCEGLFHFPYSPASRMSHQFDAHFATRFGNRSVAPRSAAAEKTRWEFQLGSEHPTLRLLWTDSAPCS
jgi:hypothetical protein